MGALLTFGMKNILIGMKIFLIGVSLGLITAIFFSHFYYFRYNTEKSKRIYEISLSKGSVVLTTEKIPPGIHSDPEPIVDFYSHKSPPPDPFGMGEKGPSNHSLWESLRGELWYKSPLPLRHQMSLPIWLLVIISALCLAFCFRNISYSRAVAEHEAEQGVDPNA